jgi:hypothetical protein
MFRKKQASTAKGSPKFANVSFKEVLAAELDDVGDKTGEGDPDVIARAHKKQLTGLAFSGGGIRSATFNLGLLQALAQMGLLPLFDYLSTVSGGGYIGSWLIAWIKRQSLNEVEDRLRPEWVKQPKNHEPEEIRFLRQFSNYLTPKLGWLGADMWTVIATYLRNLFLNMIVLIAAMTCVLMVPRLLAMGSQFTWRDGTHLWWAVISLLTVVFVMKKINESLAFFRRTAEEEAANSCQPTDPAVKGGQEGQEHAGGTQGQIQRLIVLPLFFAAFVATFLFYFGDLNKRPITPWAWWMCALVSGGVVAVLFFVTRVALIRDPTKKSLWNLAGETLSLSVASALGGVGVYGLYLLFKGRSLWEVTAWGTPSIIGLSMLTLTIHIGLLGRAMSDDVREWWSRLGAWLLIYSLLWVGICVVAFYASVLFDYMNSVTFFSAGWLVSTLWGVFAARSSATGDPKSGTFRNKVAQIAPYIFIVGLFLLLSLAIDLLIPVLAGSAPSLPAPGNLSEFLSRHWTIMDHTNTWFAVGLLFGGALAVTALFSWRLDINQFSMHLLYRNRLGRCYLGASNPYRRAQPFTGFAADDDFNLCELEKVVDGEGKRRKMPYLIINAALNLVGGKELAWQQRKAASFVFTPKYCGYEFPELPPGYSRTEPYAATPAPVTLATAMAISGAAASPNMGYHTSPASAFLMTVFNVRLGWWLGNPRQEATWQKSSPSNVLLSLLCELFGLTSEEGKYIYLSDGGHFENLGIYELVRRRCRFIIASDAEEDHSFGFGGLGNAIEKCRADLGVDIDIDVEPIRKRSEQGHSQWHCAIGTIRYSKVDHRQRDGILVYLKSSLTGDEPTDVLRYAAENREFPHQTTGDQWFDESQFEGYRALGCHIAHELFGALGEPEQIATRKKEELFVDLAEHWYPPSAATQQSFTKHTRAVVDIYDELRTNEHLAFLSEQIYPEWTTLFATTDKLPFPQLRRRLHAGSSRSLQDRLPTKPEELRAGFYICNSVIQVMEDAYLDLRLEEELDHPDNRGWMNYFKHWSWAPMFRVTWTISASSYGARFQKFCERHLNLTIGDVDVDPLNPGLALTNLTEWLSTPSARLRLNQTERELISWFFQQNQSLAPGAQVYVFELSPSSPGRRPASSAAKDLRFGFGFAILNVEKQNPPALLYLRVQDHLRTMGLARRALEALMQKTPGLVTDLKEMHPDAHEVPTEEDGMRFRQLFSSVRAERQQEQGAASGAAQS